MVMMKSKMTASSAAFIHASLCIKYVEGICQYFRDGYYEVPGDLPLLSGNSLEILIRISDGKILGWPPFEKPYDIRFELWENGTYTIFGKECEILAHKENVPIPSTIIPTYNKKYVYLQIDRNGYITNWNKNASLSEFIEPKSDLQNAFE